MRRGTLFSCLQWGCFFLLTGALALNLTQLLRGGLLNPNFGYIHTAYNWLLGIYPTALYLLALLFGLLGMLLKPAGVRRIGFALFCFTLGSLFFGLRFYVTHVEPERLRIHRVEFVTDKVSAPLRIIHITDTHFPKWGNYEKRVIQTLEDLNADLIIHSGDFVQAVEPATFAEIWQQFTDALRGMSQPQYGIYGVFGDTDWDIHRLPVMEREPIQLLSSRSQIIPTHAGMLDLFGLNLSQSRYPEWGLRAIDRWLENSPDGIFRIAIGHAPDFAMKLETATIDLILAGHTHGGQVRLPGIGPLVIDSDVPPEWSMGLRRIGVPYLNVSAGAGSNRFEGLPPIRFGCPTEITVFDILPSGALED
jgi:predicted MPP superfamily phosphohydrolase